MATFHRRRNFARRTTTGTLIVRSTEFQKPIELKTQRRWDQKEQNLPSTQQENELVVDPSVVSRDPWKRATEFKKRMNADINLTKRELCFIKDEAATWKNKCETLELKVEILSVESRKEGSKIKDLGKQIQEHLSTVRTCNHQVEELQKALADKNQQTILLQSDTSQLAIQHQKEMERLQRQLNQSTRGGADHDRCRKSLENELETLKNELSQLKLQHPKDMIKIKTQHEQLLKEQIQIARNALDENKRLRSQLSVEKDMGQTRISTENTEIVRLYNQNLSNEKRKVKELQDEKTASQKLLHQAILYRKTIEDEIMNVRQMAENENLKLEQKHNGTVSSLQERINELQTENLKRKEKVNECEEQDKVKLSEALCTVDTLTVQLSENEELLQQKKRQFDTELDELQKDIDTRLKDLMNENAFLRNVKSTLDSVCELGTRTLHCYSKEQHAKNSMDHLDGLVKIASLSNVTSKCAKYKLMLEAAHQENALLRFSSSAAETQVRKYDVASADNITHNRRLQIQKVHEEAKDAQQDLEQRARDASLINGLRLKKMYETSKSNYFVTKSASELSCSQLQDIISSSSSSPVGN